MEIKNIFYRDRIFKVDSDGNVYKFDLKTPRKMFKNTSGYRVFSIGNNLYIAHRIIATAFVDNPFNKKFVNHIDGNKENNAASNLEWVTQSENEIHSIHVLGNRRNMSGLAKTWIDSPNKKPLNLYTMDWVFIRRFESGNDCAEYLKCTTSAVSMAIRGINQSVKQHRVKSI